MVKLTVDQRLVQRCQMAGKGDHVHWLNNRLQVYYAYVDLANEGREDKVSKAKKIEEELRIWWFKNRKVVKSVA